MDRRLWIIVVSFYTLANPQSFEQSIAPIINDAIFLALSHKSKPESPIPVIAIAGCFAVGKSFFSTELVRALERHDIKAVIIREDNFLEFKPVPGANAIHPYLNANAISTVLSGIALGALQVNQPYLKTCKHGYNIRHETVNYEKADIILFEGVYSLCGPRSFDFRKYCAFGIFMETSDDNIYKWDWERNLSKPKAIRKSKKRFKKSFKGCMLNYTQYILPYRSQAKYIIYKREKNSYSISTK